MNIRTHNALTLTELLVSTILMGIVMVGIAGFSVFIKQARDSTSTGSLLAIQVATAMHYITEDANKAVGDSSDRGVRFDGPQQSICFRRDVNDPASYADDVWACYWYDAASDALWKCADIAAAGVVPPANFAACNTSGAIRLVTIQPAETDYFEVINDADGRFQYVDIELNAIANPNQPVNPMTNPTHKLFTRISPPAHGR